MIRIVEHDVDWANRFMEIRARIEPWLAGVDCRIEHVGSTSVPGLAAKPIIDVSLLCDDRNQVRQVVGLLVSNGYEHLGDLGVPGREAFQSRPGGPTSTLCGLARHNLYAGWAEVPAFRNHLAFRDALRVDADLAKRYGDLKRALAGRVGSDRERYTAEKTDFIIGVLRGTGRFDEESLREIRYANI